MIRKVAILAAFLPLCGCMSIPALHMPSFAPKPAPAASVAAAPTVCPASITADIDPLPDVPDDAKLPAIEDGAPQDLQDGFRSYTSWLHSYAYVAKGYLGRLQDAQTWCAGLQPH